MILGCAALLHIRNMKCWIDIFFNVFWNSHFPRDAPSTTQGHNFGNRDRTLSSFFRRCLNKDLRDRNSKYYFNESYRLQMFKITFEITWDFNDWVYVDFNLLSFAGKKIKNPKPGKLQTPAFLDMKKRKAFHPNPCCRRTTLTPTWPCVLNFTWIKTHGPSIVL